MYCFYVYHGKKRGAIMARDAQDAIRKFETVNQLKVTKIRNAHTGQMMKIK
jgi:hypothetical protein